MTPSSAEARAFQTGSGTAERTRWLAGVLAPYLPRSGPVIELGAGGLTRHLEIWCVEPELTLATQTPHRTVVAAPGSLPFPDRCAMAIIATSQRPFSDPAAFAEAYRVLADSARMLLALPDPAPPADDPIRAILTPMRAALEPVSRRNALARLVHAAEAAGFDVARQTLPPRPYRQSPAAEARDLNGRATSILWGVDAATWDRFVAPAIEALLRLPDPEKPVRRNAYYHLLTLSKAARDR